MKIRKIAVVTGSRAEYGNLKTTLLKIKNDPKLELALIVTGTHLIEEAGYTINDIKKDSFEITKEIDMKLKSDLPVDIAKSMGEIIKGMSDALLEIKPDILLLIADRYEMLSAAVAAIPFNIPIAHIAGGAITEGAMDDKIRHAITKLSHIHFTIDDNASKVLVSMGEEKWRINNTGLVILDFIKNTKFLGKQELKEKIDLNFNKKVMLFMYHPVTLEADDTERQIKNALEAITKYDAEIVAMLPNHDPVRNIIVKHLREASEKYKNIKLFKHFSKDVFLSLLKNCDIMVGNSSSAMLEAPSFKVPAVNIGNRQKGRSRVGNVIDCDYEVNSIKKAIDTALYDINFKKKLMNITNPFGDGNSADRIVKILKEIKIDDKLLKKKVGDNY